MDGDVDETAAPRASARTCPAHRPAPAAFPPAWELPPVCSTTIYRIPTLYQAHSRGQKDRGPVPMGRGRVGLKVKVPQSCPALCDPHGLYSPWNSPGQNTGVGSLSLLQGIFLTQDLKPGLPHCRQILYQLCHNGSPRNWSG